MFQCLCFSVEQCLCFSVSVFQCFIVCVSVFQCFIVCVSVFQCFIVCVCVSVSDSSVQHMPGAERDTDHFKLLLTEGSSMLVGAK